MRTENYLLKQIVNFIFSEKIYHQIKLYKIIFDYKFRKPYEISPILSYLIRDGDIVLDIGANMGQFACRFNDAVRKTGHVYSFEPVSFNYTALLKMKKKLNLQYLTVFNYAISDKNGLDTIRIPILSNGLVVGTQSSLLKKEKENFFREESVEVRSIDSIFKELNISRIDFIKSDTEGNELSVLTGATSLIKSNLPSMYLEMNYNNDGLQPFYEMGYVALHFNKKRILKIIDIQIGNLILVHKNKIKSLGKIYREN